MFYVNCFGRNYIVVFFSGRYYTIRINDVSRMLIFYIKFFRLTFLKLKLNSKYNRMCVQVEKEIVGYWPGTTQVKTRTWYNESNQIHKVNGPAYVEYNKNNTIKILAWFQDGKKHKEDGPAFIYYKNGIEYCTEWYQLGLRHRTDGPAYIRCNSEAKYEIKYEAWFIQGQRHRTDGSAYIIKYLPRFDSRKMLQEYWFYEGNLHREKGPNAIIHDSEEKYEYCF